VGTAYHHIRSAWPTFADGRRLDVNSDPSALDILDARIDALDDEHLEEQTEHISGHSVTEYGAEVAADFDEFDADTSDEEYAAVGAKAVRDRLKAELRELIPVGSDVEFEFDGLRWWATAGTSSNNGDPSDGYNLLIRLAMSQIAEAPIDGDEFLDVPAVAATVAVLDDLADTTLRALRTVGLPAEAQAAVEAALAKARGNVTGQARLIRKVITNITEQRVTDAWRSRR
jgi:hypothetical protein